jgi:hypothetical protein
VTEAAYRDLLTRDAERLGRGRERLVELRGFEPLASCMPCHPRSLTPPSPTLADT